jgi:DNA-binding CsgD family transcriptional regulator
LDRTLFNEGVALCVAMTDLLTLREAEVLALIAQGKIASEVAQTLNITKRTVSAHLEKICKKLGATNSVHAVAIAMTRRLIEV